MKCRDCNKPAVAVDEDYDEGYCLDHYTEAMASSEPIINVRWLR